MLMIKFPLNTARQDILLLPLLLLDRKNKISYLIIPAYVRSRVQTLLLAFSIIKHPTSVDF